MQPQQPIQPVYSPQPAQNDGTGFTQKQKKIMLGAGVLASVMLLIIIFAAVFGGRQSATEVALTSVSVRNSELLRLASVFESDLRTNEAKTYTTRAQLLLTSDNRQITGYIFNEYGSAMSEEQEDSAQFSEVSASLQSQINQNDFDEVFMATLRSEIDLNRAILKQLNLEDDNTALRTIILVAIANYDSLL